MVIIFTLDIWQRWRVSVIRLIFSDCRKNKKMYIKATEKMNQRHPGKKGGRFNKAKRTR